MPEKSVLDYCTTQVLETTQQIESRLVKLKRLRARFSYASEAHLQFKVVLSSLWADQGEKSVEIVGNTLEAAMQEAIAEFKKINKRSDVQANYYVSAFLPTDPDSPISLPEQYWRPFKERS